MGKGLIGDKELFIPVQAFTCKTCGELILEKDKEGHRKSPPQPLPQNAVYELGKSFVIVTGWEPGEIDTSHNFNQSGVYRQRVFRTASTRFNNIRWDFSYKCSEGQRESGY